MYGHELDSQGFFLCDILSEDQSAEVPSWTRDPVLQPANRPQYVGGHVVGNTGERAGGNWIDAQALSAEEAAELEFKAQQAHLTDLIHRRLNSIAAERGYDSILSLCSYATSNVPKFRAEGQAGVDLRDQCWVIGYRVLSEVARGLRGFPSDEEALAMMPPMVWPDESM